jgi:hypothetical protein
VPSCATSSGPASPAIAKPIAVPEAATIRLSISTGRINRQRDAPSAARTLRS